MIHGPSRILTCPHCKSKNEVISLLSGNTSGGVVWSDQYVKYPFYKVASYIQKCLFCGKYYIIDDEIELPISTMEVKGIMGDTDNTDSQCFKILNTKDYDWSKSTDNTGELDFLDMHRALIQLSKEVNTNEEKRKLYINYIQCFNTHFFRNNDKRRIPTPVNWAWFVDCVAKYIPLTLESEVIFVAELQREIGLFDACIKTLRKLENEKEEQFYDFRKIIFEKARNKDSEIFIWKTISDEESSIYIREIPE
jgi:hypothetical protein